MKIRKIEMMRLYAVSETPNRDGLYDILPFDGNESDFNQEFERENLDAELDAMVDRFYGGGTYIEVDETDDLETCGECIRLQIGEERIEVPDILGKINADPDNSTTYLLVNRTLEEGCWVVAERCDS